MQLRLEEELGRKTYFRWELYSIARIPLGTADKKLLTKRIGIMTGSKEEQQKREIEGGAMSSHPNLGLARYNSA